jgi:hypothetical protein
VAAVAAVADVADIAALTNGEGAMVACPVEKVQVCEWVIVIS